MVNCFTKLIKILWFWFYLFLRTTQTFKVRILTGFTVRSCGSLSVDTSSYNVCHRIIANEVIVECFLTVRIGNVVYERAADHRNAIVDHLREMTDQWPEMVSKAIVTQALTSIHMSYPSCLAGNLSIYDLGQSLCSSNHC